MPDYPPQPPRPNNTGSPSPKRGWLAARACTILYPLNCVIRVLLALTFPVYYKEAYYWEWSRFPSLGYLDHPPLVAWLIRASGYVFGQRCVFGIRFGALLLGSGSLLLVYHLALKLFDDRSVALRSLLVALSLPILNAMGVLMMPDAPLMFFHLLFLYLFVSALRGGKTRDWYLAGLVLGLALLSKLMAVLTLAGAGMFLIISREHRFWLRRRQPYVALLLALLVFSPYLYWNAANGWPTIRLCLWDHHLHQVAFSIRNIGEFALEQLANTSVFLFVPMVGALFVRRKHLPPQWRPWYSLLKCQCVTVLVFFLVVGSAAQTHPHWTILAYPTAGIALAALAACRPRHLLTRHLTALIALSVGSLIVAAGLAVSGVSLLRRIPPQALGGRVGVAQTTLFGWRELHSRLAERVPSAPDGDEAVVFTESQRRAVMLSFHGEGRPVVFLSASYGLRMKTGHGQLFYIPQASLAGKGGIFITGPLGDKRYRRLFDSVEETAPLEMKYSDDLVVRYRIFRVKGFRPFGRAISSKRSGGE